MVAVVFVVELAAGDDGVGDMAVDGGTEEVYEASCSSSGVEVLDWGLTWNQPGSNFLSFLF